MPNDKDFEQVRDAIQEAYLRLKDLESRLTNGEDVSDEERAEVAKAVAYSLMDANDTMRSMFGPEAQQEVEARMIADMSEEEYAQWCADYPLREAMRQTRRLEREQNG